MMSHSRWIGSLLSLAIFFANACCLAHTAPTPVSSHAAGKVHACCRKAVVASQQDHQPQPSKGCACCQHDVAKVAPVHPTTHAPLMLLTIASVDTHCVNLSATLSSPLFVNAHGPPASADVLQQSCTLIL